MYHAAGKIIDIGSADPIGCFTANWAAAAAATWLSPVIYLYVYLCFRQVNRWIVNGKDDQSGLGVSKACQCPLRTACCYCYCMCYFQLSFNLHFFLLVYLSMIFLHCQLRVGDVPLLGFINSQPVQHGIVLNTSVKSILNKVTTQVAPPRDKD